MEKVTPAEAFLRRLKEFVDGTEPTQPCLHEAMDKANPSMVGQPRCLSCSCPKCSPHSMVSK